MIEDNQRRVDPATSVGGGVPVEQNWIPHLLALYAIVGGATSLLGWIINKPTLSDWFSTGIAIQPNTALATMLAGFALVLLAAGNKRAAAVPGVIAGLIGLATLFQYALRTDFGIDTMLMFEREWGRTGTTAPGRMGFPAGVSWTLLGVAFLCTLGAQKLRQTASVIGLLVALISALSLLGYLFSADTLFTLPALTAISLQTATFLLAISVGLVTGLRHTEPMRSLLAPTGAGLLARRALPFILLVPPLVGFMRQRGEAAGLYDSQFGTALRTAVEVILFSLLLWWAVRIVRHRETEIEAAGESLALSERELSDFFENASVGLHWVGPDGKILRVNQAELDLLGYTREEYLGRHIGDFHVHQPVIQDILERLSRGEVLHEYPAQMRHKDGRIVEVLINSSVLFDRNEFIHTRCFTRDVTKQKHAEEALREADRRKDEFLATLAHELRNPLAPISNSLQLMKYADGNRRLVSEAREVAERQVEHMVRLIDDLLDLSRITRNKLELRKERLDFASVVDNAAEACRDMVEKNGHELAIEIPSESIIVEADPVRITQVVTNLVNNACKFMDAGGVIRVAIDSEGDKAKLSVKDSGIGIPPEMLDKVFEMFTQVDRSLERPHAGLGIGLSLTRRLVELHGGSISASSQGEGMGSEFIVLLPAVIGVTEMDPVQSVSTDQPQGTKRILVVDDNTDSAESLALLLKLYGNDTQTASDGAEAISKGAEYRPDVILLDIGMPGINGYDACQMIRAEPWGKDILLIAMTGWGQEDDRRRSAEVGFDHHLVKPIDHPALLDLLSDRSGSGEAPPMASGGMSSEAV